MTARRLAHLITGVALAAALVAVAAGCGSSSGGSGSGGAGGGSASGASLAGTSWRLTGWSRTAQDPNQFTITATFKDGRIGGTSAVNQYGGPYTASDDGSFSVGDMVSTMMAGPEPDMRAEAAYMKLLPAMTSWRVDGDTLTLSGAGGQDLVYTRTAAASPSP